jgi:hypothetical protein
MGEQIAMETADDNREKIKPLKRKEKAKNFREKLIKSLSSSINLLFLML